MKKITALFMVLVLMMALSACGNKGTKEDSSEQTGTDSSDTTVVKFWSFHAGGEAEFLENVVKEYNAAHDDVQIEHTVVNQSDYTTTLIPTAYANGEAPDILSETVKTVLKRNGIHAEGSATMEAFRGNGR